MDLLICGAHHQKWDIKGLICTILIIVLYIVNISFGYVNSENFLRSSI